MKRVGYAPHKAASFETAASVNGQIMPPVMGAAAFLMVEYVGIPYVQIIKHAALPAIISYIALFYIVHLEACKANIEGIPRAHVAPFMQRLINFVLVSGGIVLLANAVYFGLGWIKGVAGAYSMPVISALTMMTYIGLLKYEAGFPELLMDDPNAPIDSLPDAGPTIKSGLHFLLPVVALIWNLMVEELSPALSAFWAIMFLVFILVTQRPLSAWFRGKSDLGSEFKAGFADLHSGLEIGARNMIGVGIATATAGIIVGTVTLTGIGLVLTELVEAISGGNLLAMLLLVAAASLILGMGMPTTANYIIVSTLMAPVVVELGSQAGLIVPLIAVHLFVFYFGIMADVTPPVGLAAYAAAGIARADPMKTGFTAFWYSIRTAILPFMFIYNTQLLLIGIDSASHLLVTIASAILANLVFVAASQNWFLTRSRWYETIGLLFVAFALFRPGFFMDDRFPPYEKVPAAQLMEVVDKVPKNGRLRVWTEGVDINGRDIKRGVLLHLEDSGPARERLDKFGLKVLPSGDQFDIIMVRFGSRAEKLGVEQGHKITALEVETDNPSKEWFYVPTLALLGLIAFLQRRRLQKSAT